MPGAKLSNLNAFQKVALKTWALRFNPNDRAGLWAFGPRTSGTSYLAEVAYDRLLGLHKKRVEAVTLIALIRDYWNLQDMVKRHPDDYGLWLEMNEVDNQIQGCWSAPALWVDNLHDDLDLAFWRRFIQPWLELSLREGRVVIIATTISPDDPDFARGVIAGYFVTVFCDGTR